MTSCTKLDAIYQLPRFNMPLELGLFLGEKRFGGVKQKQKRALILEVEQYRYQRLISDLAGMDPAISVWNTGLETGLKAMTCERISTCCSSFAKPA